MVEPIQVLDLSETKQKHLLYHFAAFSADVTREDVFGVQQYKYCTVLLPEEYTAYTHLPRVSEVDILYCTGYSKVLCSIYVERRDLHGNDSESGTVDF